MVRATNACDHSQLILKEDVIHILQITKQKPVNSVISMILMIKKCGVY